MADYSTLTKTYHEMRSQGIGRKKIKGLIQEDHPEMNNLMLWEMEQFARSQPRPDLKKAFQGKETSCSRCKEIQEVRKVYTFLLCRDCWTEIVNSKSKWVASYIKTNYPVWEGVRGRPKIAVASKQIKKLANEGMSSRTIAEKLNVSYKTIQRRLKGLGQN